MNKLMYILIKMMIQVVIGSVRLVFSMISKMFSTTQAPKELAQVLSIKNHTRRGFAFEKYVQNLIEKKHGIKSISGIEYLQSLGRAPKSGDQGVDLVFKNNQGETVIVQCKCYSQAVSNGAAQEIIAAQSTYKATRTVIVTNQVKFTESFRQLAKDNNIEVIDGSVLAQWEKAC